MTFLHILVSTLNNAHLRDLATCKVDSHSPKQLTITIKFINTKNTSDKLPVCVLHLKASDSYELLRKRISEFLQLRRFTTLEQCSFVINNRAPVIPDDLPKSLVELGLSDNKIVVLCFSPQSNPVKIAAIKPPELTLQPTASNVAAASSLSAFTDVSAAAQPSTQPCSPESVAEHELEPPPLQRLETVVEFNHVVQALPMCILSEPKYFKILFDLLDSKNTHIVDLAWSLIKLLPTNTELKHDLLALENFNFELMFGRDHVHRSIYLLQAIINFCEKARSGLDAKKADWLRRFVACGGPSKILQELVKTDMSPPELHQKWLVKRRLFFLNALRALLVEKIASANSEGKVEERLSFNSDVVSSISLPELLSHLALTLQYFPSCIQTIVVTEDAKNVPKFWEDIGRIVFELLDGVHTVSPSSLQANFNLATFTPWFHRILFHHHQIIRKRSAALLHRLCQQSTEQQIFGAQLLCQLLPSLDERENLCDDYFVIFENILATLLADSDQSAFDSSIALILDAIATKCLQCTVCEDFSSTNYVLCGTFSLLLIVLKQRSIDSGL